MKKVLRLVSNWAVFFLLAAFVTTCCMLLFVSTLSGTLGITLTAENLSGAAKITFLNVILISVLFTAIDSLRRWITFERPIKKMIDAAEKIAKGDFNVRVKSVKGVAVEENLNKVIDCFNKMAEELSGIETLRTDFIANVSHELKTPLAVMQNYATMLQSPAFSDEKRIEYAKAISDASRRLANLVTNILKLNKLENQQVFPNIENYDLGEQLCESLLQFENEWEKKNIDIATDIQDGVSINADRELLSLVWNNLFSNAFKFTPDGGTVTVTLTANDTHAIVKVSDTGCGMTPEIGAHIFEKFYQGDTSHSGKGNGLGLALVKRVVDITRGEISVQSSLGVGSTFTVKIGRN